jgi:hypothetical protein
MGWGRSTRTRSRRSYPWNQFYTMHGEKAHRPDWRDPNQTPRKKTKDKDGIFRELGSWEFEIMEGLDLVDMATSMGIFN